MAAQTQEKPEDLGDLLQEVGIAFAKAGQLDYLELKSGRRIFVASERLARFAAHAIALQRIRVRSHDFSLTYNEAIALDPGLPQQILNRAKAGDLYQWSWLSNQLTEAALRELLRRLKNET